MFMTQKTPLRSALLLSSQAGHGVGPRAGDPPGPLPCSPRSVPASPDGDGQGHVAAGENEAPEGFFAHQSKK